MFVEASRDTPKLLFRFHDVFAANIVGMLHNELLDFVVKLGNFPHAQGNLALSVSRPHQGSVESFRRQVSRKKGDRIKAEPSGRSCSCTKVAVIEFLDRGAAGYLHIRLLLMNRRDASGDYIECSMDAPDSIVDLPRPVDRDDHIIEQGGDIVCALEQQQARG
jgi:hypothetical protein